MMKLDRTPTLTQVADYAGQRAVRVMATQLGPGYSDAQARRIVGEWQEFFSAGPSAIRDLEFVSRTPSRLFDALSGQTQLHALNVKWGDYSDLTALSGMTELRSLRLRGASGVVDLEPLSSLGRVETLQVESLRKAHDLAPIGLMAGVRSLELGGDWMSPRIAHVESVGFLRQMPRLRQLVLHTMVVDDLDYSPILDLHDLTSVWVKEVRRIRPDHATLTALKAWRT